MLSTKIIIAGVALIAGHAGATWQKKRQGCVTKMGVTELRRDLDEIRLIFNEDWDVHKTLKFQVETFNRSVEAFGQFVGMDRSALFIKRKRIVQNNWYGIGAREKRVLKAKIRLNESQ